jgi:hypothetical protein
VLQLQLPANASSRCQQPLLHLPQVTANEPVLDLPANTIPSTAFWLSFEMKKTTMRRGADLGFPIDEVKSWINPGDAGRFGSNRMIGPRKSTLD